MKQDFLTFFTMSVLSLTSCGNPTKEVFINYSEKKKEIELLEAYFSKIKPEDLVLYIRYNSDNNIDFKIDQKNYWDKNSWYTDSIFDEYGQFHRFDVDINDKELMDAYRITNLEREELEKLKSYLEKANCISISNRFSFSDDIQVEYTSIGYPTHDMYGLYYVIFEKELKKNNVDKIIERCDFKKIDNKAFVQYGGPAFGSDCFPDKK